MKLHRLGAGCLVAATSLSYVVAQTQIDLRTQAKRVDFSNASSTKPSKTGIVLPALCTVGETFLKLDAKPGANLYVCTAANVWAVQGSPLPDYVAGSYGKVLTNDDAGMGWESLGGDVTGAPDALTVSRLQGRPVAPAAPSNGHVLSWDGAQWSPQAVQMPALTGDVTTGAGSTVTTLSSVNGAPGICGDATHVCQVTTNSKGLVTGQNPVAVSATSGGISALNGLSTGNQNFVDDANVTITSAGSSHALGWNGVLGLARGGLNADLSKTGGAHQVLQQSSAGAPVMVGALTSGDISGLAASATTDATNASNITSGTLPNGRLSAVPNTALANSSVTVAAGNGLSGGGPATLGGSVTLSAAMPVNAQAGTSYTMVAGDGGKLITLNNASAVSVTLPQATGAFGAGWYTRVRNLGAGAVTITPATSTIDGAGSLVLQNEQGVEIASDGANYQTWRGYTWQPSAAGSHQFARGISGAGVVSYAQPVAADVAGLAASATTDATNASNITSGTLPNARLSAVPNTALANSSVTVAAGNGLSGGGATALGGSVTLNAAMPVNAQTGTTYTMVAGDGGKLITFNNASAVSVTLPQANGVFGAGWYARVRNLGAGAATITPVTSTIDGAGSVVLQSGQGVEIASDGTNYQAWRGYTWLPSAAGSHQFATGISGAGVVSYGQPGAADITGLAPSATTDATNAANIASGTLGAGRMPQFTGGQVTSPAPGSAVLNIGSGSVTNAMLAGSIATSKLANTQGTGSNVLTAGTVSGTGALLCTDASGGATTSGCAAGAGTVTVVGNGNLTTAALVTGGSSQTLQTPAATATMDSSGNIQTPGTVQTGYGSSNAGAWAFVAGTATAAPANSVGFQAPASVPSAYRITLPAAPAAGVVYRTNATPSVESIKPLQGTDSNILTVGTVSGTGAPLCTDANGGATTTGCSTGTGSVTVVGAGNLTSTALVTGGGTQTLQTPAATATMDLSGNIQTPGTVQAGYGSSNAGAWAFLAGTGTPAPASSVGFQAPTSVTSAYRITLPGAPAAGFVRRTNATPSVESVVPAITLSDVDGSIAKNFMCVAATASGTAYACNFASPPASLVSGERYWFQADVDNTGSATVAFNSFSARSIKKVVGGITASLDPADIRAGAWVGLVYDGANFQMVSPLGNAPAGGSSSVPTGVSNPAPGPALTWSLQAGDLALILNANLTLTASVLPADRWYSRTIQVCQPASGGPYTLTWPSNVHGGMVIGTVAGACSVQFFKSFDGVSLYATSAGVVNQ